MAKRNGKVNPRRNNKPMTRKDIPLPKTLPADLKPYDTNNDGVLSTEERSAMRIAKSRERIQKSIDERRAEIKKANKKPDKKN